MKMQYHVNIVDATGTSHTFYKREQKNVKQIGMYVHQPIFGVDLIVD